MKCPHCKEDLPNQVCPACQRPALNGAGFCHHCGQALPAPLAEPPKLIACDSCGRQALPEAHYCAGCGQPLAGGGATAGEEAAGGGFDPDQRRACSDGMCIGIIGPDGKCTECGQPYNPQAQ